MKAYTYYPSPIGKLLITVEDAQLTGIEFDAACPVPPCTTDMNSDPTVPLVINWLDDYFAGKSPDIRSLPIHPAGTPFQMLVWDLLLDIPWGETTTYGELARLAARRLGKERMSAQAIGNAVGKNPIPIVIPCHRCLGAGSTLTGYAGGLDRKRFLLELEKIKYI